MMAAATEKARLPRFSFVLGIESCCEVDDLSCLGMLEKCRRLARCRPLLSQSGLRGGRGVRAVGVATLNANSVKKQSINAKSEPSKCSGLAISRRRQNYVNIGVEFRPQG